MFGRFVATGCGRRRRPWTWLRRLARPARPRGAM